MPGQRGPRGRAGRAQVGHRRPDHHRPGAEHGPSSGRDPPTGSATAAEHDHQAVAEHAGQHVDPGVPGGPLQRVQRSAPVAVRRRPRSPPPPGRWRAQPSAAARLSSVSSTSPRSSTSTTSDSSRASQAPRVSAALRVHLRRRRRRSPGVAQQRLPQHHLLARRGEALAPRSSTTSTVTRTISTVCWRRDRPGQLLRRRPEDRRWSACGASPGRGTTRRTRAMPAWAMSIDPATAARAAWTGTRAASRPSGPRSGWPAPPTRAPTGAASQPAAESSPPIFADLG